MRLVFWGLVALMAVIYGAMVLWSLPILAGMSDGEQMFDLRPGGYSYDEARMVLSRLGATGRVFYLQVQQKLDACFPALLAVVLAMSYQRLFSKHFAVLATGFAVFGAGFDYLENAVVAGMLRAGADGVTVEMVAAASRWTIAKYSADSVAFVLLLYGLGQALWRRWHRMG